MSAIRFDEIVTLTQQLTLAEQAQLIEKLATEMRFRLDDATSTPNSDSVWAETDIV